MLKGFKNLINNYVQLSEEDWIILECKIKVQEFAKGTVIQESNKASKEMHFITNGAIRSYIEKDGNEITWNFYFPGGIATDFQSFLTGQPSPLKFIAIDRTTVLSLSQKDIQEISKKSPAVVVIEKIFAQKAFLDIRARMESFLLQSAEERYISLIHNNAQLIQKLPNKDIATYLGIAPQSLSRIKARLYKTKVE